MKQGYWMWMAAPAAALGLAACDVEQTEPGNLELPEYEQTEQGDVDLPAYDVDAPDVDVDVDMPEVDVPDVMDVDVEGAEGGDADEVPDAADTGVGAETGDADTEADEQTDTQATGAME